MGHFIMSSHYRRCVAALLAILGIGSATAQEPGSPDRVFFQQVGVEVVSIDVVVTGTNREPVRGLTGEDFELRIDGKPVEITNFYATQGRPTAPASPAPSVEAVDAPAVPEAVDTSETTVRAVVFFDNFYLAPNGRKRLLEDMPAFLEKIVDAGTEVMIVAHDRRTQILSPFTTEMDELTHALAQEGELPASGHAQRRQRMSTLRSIADLFESCANPCVNCWEPMIAFASSYRSEIENDRFATLDALGELVNALNLYEGRKVLYYLSDGIQLQGGAAVFHYLGEICPTNYRERRVVEARLRLEGLNDFHRLTAAANASRVSIYSIEAAGLRGFSAASVEMNRNPSPVNDSIRIGNLQNSLTLFAHETGGRAVLNANHFDSELSLLSDELGSFYSLGYTPSHPGEGRTHRVTVKVRGGKHDVRFRRSYLHKGADQLLADKTLGAFFLGNTANPLAAKVGAGDPRVAEAGRFVVPVSVSVPWEKLTFLPGEGTQRLPPSIPPRGRHGRLTLLVGAPDSKGKKTSLRKMTIPLDKATATGGSFRTGVHITVPEGEHDLWVAVLDEIADITSYFKLRVHAGVETSGDDGLPGSGISSASFWPP